MINISGFLEKFLNLEKDKNGKLLLIVEAIKKETGIELSKEMLELKEENLKLKCSAVFRNEIFMHWAEIDAYLKSQKIFLKVV